MPDPTPKLTVEDENGAPHAHEEKASTKPPRTRSKSPTSRTSVQASTLNYKISLQFTKYKMLSEQSEELKTYFNSSVTAEDVLAKQEVIETYWDSFLSEHNNLANTCSPDFLNSDYVKDNLYEKAFKSYSQSLHDLKKQYYMRTKPHVDQTHQRHSCAHSSTDHLPEIKIPPFNGDYADWPNFRDLFSSMVKDHPTLPLVKKMHYLKTTLEGSARQLISSVPTAGEFFDSCWETLLDRYENKRLLISAQVDKLLKLKTCTPKSAGDLNMLINTVNESVNTLKAFGSPVQHWDHILVPIIASKLDFITKEAWEIKLGSSTEMPQRDTLITFITGRARALERLDNTITFHSENSLRSAQKSQQKGKSHYPSRTQHYSNHQQSAWTHTTSAQPHSTNNQSNYYQRKPTTQDPKTLEKGSTQRSGQPMPVKYPCDMCGGWHYIVGCPEFFKLNQVMRAEKAKEKNLCTNCLGHHLLKDCGIKKRCKFCNEPHHSMLHNFDQPRTVHGQLNRIPNNDQTGPRAQPLIKAKIHEDNSSLIQSRTFTTSQVLLATSLADLITQTNSQTVRLLIDPGSEITLVSDALVTHLKLPRQRSSLSIKGIGASHAGKTRGMVFLTLKSRYSSHSINIAAHILGGLTGALPSFSPNTEPLKQFCHLQLADPDYMLSRPIDIIIGADSYGSLIRPDIISHSPSMAIAQLTIFGWVILGPVKSLPTSLQYVHHAAVNHDIDQLQDLLTKFWTQQEVPEFSGTELTPEEAACEVHFKTTHSRDSTGRYIVRLPLTASPSHLGNSSQTAHHCLQHLLRRLDKNPTYKHLYSSFLEEYEALGHMKRIKDSDICSSMHSDHMSSDHSEEVTSVHGSSASGELKALERLSLGFSPTHQLTHAFYLPHHGVLREDSKTTKLRVVFNGSRKTQSGFSLNDILHIGPKIQKDITDVLLWIRLHKFIFSTDITKMYRQIMVNQKDWDLQRIIWVDEHNNPVHFHLTTVIYGTRSAPFLAVRVLFQLMEDEGKNYPLAIAPLTHGRYVDDIFGGADTINELQDTANQLTDICMAGGFPLAKWTSNYRELTQCVQAEAHTITHIFNDSENSTKVLGLHWSTTSDQFFFKFKPPSNETHTVTKRIILSEVAQLFDPLGFLSPLIIRAKIFLQELWLVKIGWDEQLPQQLREKWASFKNELSTIPNIEIPRWINITTDSSIELHGFSDASRLAMAAVVYIKVHSLQSGNQSTLVCSKTKVAPIKPLSIPRLELSAAVLLAKLITYCQKITNLTHVPVYLWTDSSVTLTWLHSPPSRWKDFVRNRVAFIQELLPNGRWKFVPGKQNPADCSSRGLTPFQLKNHPTWWTGPPWLLKDSQFWPTHELKVDPGIHLEERPGVALTASLKPTPRCWEIIHRFSSLTRLLRVTAILFRVHGRIKKHPDSKLTNPLNSNDLNIALTFGIKTIQQDSFSEELKLLRKMVPWPKGHNFARLTAYIDTNGIIRVGGRLNHSSLQPETKHPAILPRSSALTQLIISDAHQRTLHGGTQLTLSYIRQQFWIIGGRQPVRSFILKCMKCARHRAQRAQQLMGQLPVSRVTPSSPFTHTGVDYAGPITLKTWKGRGAKTKKGWLCVFVCFATSAVHLEAVTDYSAEGFLAAFRRFTGRRGISQVLYSDCGTNFIGADAAIKKLFTQGTQQFDEIINSFVQDKITWKFNPPAAPHMGGKWEAVVKSVKTHLMKTIGDTILTYEEFTTLLVQVEAVLNSRPLEPLTEDPDDLSVLTPGHFLIGKALSTLPEPSLSDINPGRLTRFLLIQQKLQQFWNHWSSSYLQQQQAISKWHSQANNIKVGSLVLIADERVSSSKWPLGRIIELHPGKDGLTRVVTVKTATTTLKRPINKLAVLPYSPG